LITRALDREGPDNITVVVARFEGEGLPEPNADEKMSFSVFDPGIDPADPEPPRRMVAGGDKVTEEVPVRLDALDATSPGALPTKLVSPSASTPSTTTETKPSDETTSRPFLTFILITLLAALGGALFLAFQEDNLPDLPPFAPTNTSAATAGANEPKTEALDASTLPIPR
jgi:hypothetical protein